MMKLLRRLLLLTLCMILAANSALAAGMRFTLRPTLHADAFPAGEQTLFSGLSQLFEAVTLQGVFTTSGDAFTLDATLLIGDGDAASTTTVQVWGIASHWGVRSSLLGDTELMVNCAALLPFGQKTSNYLGITLDKAALLIPYTHVHAFTSITQLLAPLFPAEDGKLTLSRDEMDTLVTEISRLCDEDPALNLWLEVTGLYRTAKYYCKAYFSIPELLLPSLTVKRSGTTLTWKSGLITVLSIREKNGTTSLEFSLPTLASAKATVQHDGDQLTCAATLDIDALQLQAEATFPVRLGVNTAPISLAVDAEAPMLAGDGLHLRITGETRGNSVTLRLLDPDTSAQMLTLEGTLVPATAEALPAWTPEDFTGVNVLSVNGDSLAALLDEVKWPLMGGLFDMVVAAPAPAVQLLMDYAEDSGLIDLMTDAMSGGSGY